MAPTPGNLRTNMAPPNGSFGLAVMHGSVGRVGGRVGLAPLSDQFLASASAKSSRSKPSPSTAAYS